MRDARQFAFARDELFPLAARFHLEYLEASPFPHVVIDDLLPPAILDVLLTEFPEHGDAQWRRFDNPQESKLALSDTEQMGPATRHLLAAFNGQVFIEFLERLTGIDGLVGDPHLVGGGLHQIRAGGFLKVHADFNRHPKLDLDRRLNALLYLNDESYGGHLQLWNKDMTCCERAVLPVFNRLVIFATTDDSNHGHPDPLTCPPGRARRSMALYYYSNGRSIDEIGADHSTLFRSRPGEKQRSNLRQSAKRWIPPALADLATRRGYRH